MAGTDDTEQPAPQENAIEPDRAAQPAGGEQPPRLPFVVVGIGASAGGLEAFSELFQAMPADSGMAFVLVQHLPPDRESMLAEILGKRAAMPVRQVEDGMAVEPDTVYVIRPGHTLTLREGALRLGAPLHQPGHNRPVDDFFRSLAEEQRERAIGVVMSGMGSNGTAGAQAIKAVGGVCIAQAPDSAAFPAMPRALIYAGYADFVLRPQDMPEVLLPYARHPYASATAPRSTEATERRARKALGEILALLRARQDFAGYKRPTVLRRIQRRMGLNQLAKLEEYARLLRESPAEVEALADDLLIHVTGFFRDPDAWEALRQEVLAPLVAERKPGAAVRCWVAACSSGEEAYSLAMLIDEECERLNKPLDVKIFATDTAARTLQHARAGIYPNGIESEISPARLERFFDREEGAYRVKKRLREMVVFAPQNILQDPPFSRLDVATCRNLLIYLEPEVQRRVLSGLHFGLQPGGALFLGNSETAPGGEMFAPIDKKFRIYRRIGSTRPGVTPFGRGSGRLTEQAGQWADAALAPRISLVQLAHRALLARHTPAAVVVDRHHNAVYFHGNVEPFLSLSEGEATRSLPALVREGLWRAVREALQQATVQGQPATIRDGRLRTAEGQRRVEVTASPLDPMAAPGYLLISFQEGPAPEAAPGLAEPSDDRGLLDEDLRRMQDELQGMIEELQTSNEGLRASNEEVMSVNEELQSSNEELETSKEELQSLNEELSTVNAQLHAKMEELEATTNDLASLLSSTDIAVIFLDTRFRIRRFTLAVHDLVELLPADVGRPLRNLAWKFADRTLLDDAQAVLDRLVPVERECESASGRHYMRRILPYRTSDNRIDGVVITFVDITARKQAEQALAASERRMRVLFELVPDLIWTSALDGGSTWFNQRWLEYTGRRQEELAADGWRALIHPEDLASSPLRAQGEGTEGAPLHQEQRIRGGDGQYRWFSLQVHPVRDGEGRVAQWFGMAADIHEQHAAFEAERAGRAEAEASEAALGRAQAGLRARIVDNMAELARINAELAAQIADRERMEEARNVVLRRLARAEEQERQRLSRELHDQLGQSNAGLSLGLKALEAAINDPGLSAKAAELRRQAERLASEIHSLALDLRPPALDTLGLAAALQDLLERLAAQHGLACDFQAVALGEGRLPPEVETAMYRVVQEGLTNVIRHAAARRVSLVLERRGGFVIAVLEDDGRGFDAEAALAVADRLGLRGMRERVALLDGELDIESSPESGTTLFVRLPESAEAQPETSEGAG